MSLDFPASGAALWALFDRGGPRPEYVLPVLYSESGFSTSITNEIGCVGINQLCPPHVPDGYASWSASQQIAGSVAPYMLALVARYGPLRSGTRVYQANFLPGTLPTATKLASTLAIKGSSADVCGGCHLSQAAVYSANPGLDWQHKGRIVLGDLAHFIARAAAAAPVQAAIAQTYALRPGESPRDPVYGDDFGAGIIELVAYGTAILGAGALLALGLRRLRLRRDLARRNPIGEQRMQQLICQTRPEIHHGAWGGFVVSYAGSVEDGLPTLESAIGRMVERMAEARDPDRVIDYYDEHDRRRPIYFRTRVRRGHVESVRWSFAREAA